MDKPFTMGDAYVALAAYHRQYPWDETHYTIVSLVGDVLTVEAPGGSREQLQLTWRDGAARFLMMVV